jgi:hypothetical protein
MNCTMEERRSANRLRTNINVRWESLKTQGRGSVCDLSATGCFVLTGGDVNSGELIQMQFVLNDEIATLWGQVIYIVNEMGFATRFVFANGDEQRLRRLLSDLSGVK